MSSFIDKRCLLLLRTINSYHSTEFSQSFSNEYSTIAKKPALKVYLKGHGRQILTKEKDANNNEEAISNIANTISNGTKDEEENNLSIDIKLEPSKHFSSEKSTSTKKDNHMTSDLIGMRSSTLESPSILKAQKRSPSRSKMKKTKRVGNKLLKRVQPSAFTNLRAEKDAIQKSKRIGKHARKSQLSPQPVPLPPFVPSPPAIPLTHFLPPTWAPQSSSLADAQLDEGDICNNNEYTPRLERKKRGVTRLKCLGIQDNPNALIEVDFNEKGQPIGDSSITLASFIGALIRHKVPILFNDWSRVPNNHKENLWTLVSLRFKLDETHKDFIFQKMANSLREYRCHVGNAVEKALKLEEEKKVETLAKLKPENLTDNKWSEFIERRISLKFQAKSILMKQVREKHAHPHTMSRLGYARLEQKMKQKKPDPEIGRALLWTKDHVDKNGNPTNKAVEESIKKNQLFNKSQPNTARQSPKDDALSHVLGADRSGRVKRFGFGVAPTKLKAHAHSKKVVLSLEEKIRAIEAKLNLINESNQQGGNACLSEADAGRSNKASSMGLPNLLVGAKCKLMSWYKEGEVVAEGEIFSTNPTDLVHFKPLGLDAWRVFVEFAVDAEAYLWRTTDEFKVVGDAIGSTIAWNKQYISLDFS